ncbi:hypothetical protein D3C87_1351350 [compost metagenome]
MSGIAGFHRLTVFVEQAEVEIEAVGLMPAERSGGTGETTADRAGSIKADHVQPFSGLGDFGDCLLSVRQRVFLHVLALPAVVVEQQVRILWQQRQGFAQLLQTFGQTLKVDFRVARQGDLQIGVATIVDQFQADARLLHLPGLPHLGVIEAHEGRRFGGITEGELLRFVQRCAQSGDQGLERLGLRF